MTSLPSESPTPVPAVSQSPHRRRRLLVAGVCWAYLALALAAWLVMRITGDRWWIATVALLFGPRWILFLPALLVGPLALAFSRRSLWIVAAAVGVVVWPVMGLRLNLVGRREVAHTAHVRVMTCNIHRLLTNPHALALLVAQENPDIVALQEWTSRNEALIFPVGEWHLLRDGELCLASRWPVRRVTDLSRLGWPGPGAAVCYEIDVPGGPTRFINMHLASPHRQFAAVLHQEASAAADVSENSATRHRQSQLVAGYARNVGSDVLLAGDFNTPEESFVFREAWRGFYDAFDTAGVGFGYTYHARPTRVRIDHILAGSGWRCVGCRVGPDVESPHRPVIADFTRTARPAD